MKRSKGIVAGVVIGIAVLASPADASRASDQRLADRAVLAIDDVSSGFVESRPSDESTPPLAGCEKLERADDAAEGVPNAETLFTLPESPDTFGVVNDGVAVFPRAAKAKSVFNAYRRPAAAECLGARIERIFTGPGINVSVSSLSSFRPQLDDKGNERIIEGGDAFFGYGAQVRTDAGGEPRFFEVVFTGARVGRSVTQIFLASGGVVPRGSIEGTLQAVVERLEAG